MAKLEISRLEKHFGGAEVLHDVSLRVENGELIAILGASGSGKTTLLRLIAGFERPERGEIRLDGEVIASASIFRQPERRGIGYVAQEGALFPHLSVADNITFGLKRGERKARARVTELLSLVGLPAHYADRPPQALSGGEQQRVALARALAPKPKLLLLDEPFSALDAGLRAETRAALADAVRQAGATAILVTHDQAEALSMGDRVGVLQNGALVQLSTPEELYRHPANPGVADFVGEAVFLPGVALHGRVDCALGVLVLGDKSLSGPVLTMIRPEQIVLHPAPASGSVPAFVQAITFHGHDAMVSLGLAQARAGEQIAARVLGHEAPSMGTQAWLSVEGEVSAYPGEETPGVIQAQWQTQ